ncbi:hypothetical protein VP1G_11111 [Cytospora mali]|uniref:Uncharacterized protein n=1 Tax=Cytospora mali TaxID=578113 RepID=A0A194V4N3_CYTMA|nr:hypothetical protein VP1G_11111 [Valsa mali var. pyri (nom. inval.)]
MDTVHHISRSWFQAGRGKAEINALTITVMNNLEASVLLAIHLRECWNGAGTLRYRPSREDKEATWFYKRLLLITSHPDRVACPRHSLGQKVSPVAEHQRYFFRVHRDRIAVPAEQANFSGHPAVLLEASSD